MQTRFGHWIQRDEGEGLGLAVRDLQTNDGNLMFPHPLPLPRDGVMRVRRGWFRGRGGWFLFGYQALGFAR